MACKRSGVRLPLAPPFLHMILDIYLYGLRGSELPAGAVVTVVQAVAAHRVVTADGSEFSQEYGAES